MYMYHEAKRVAVLFIVLGLASPAVAQMMYWTSDSGQSIHRASIDGGQIEDLVTGEPDPVGLALDIFAGKMYWSERFGGIRRANLDGSAAETVIEMDSSFGPRGVALDVGAGKIYWVCDTADTIQRANLDGSDIETLHTAQAPAGLLGITLDTEAGKMYWGDSSSATISRADLDGSNVEVIVDSGSLTPYYIEADLVAGHLYWTDYYYNAIHRANLDGSDHVTLIDTYPERPVGIALDVPGGKVYWSLYSGSVQRANLNGSDVEDVVTDLPVAWAVELDLRAEQPAIPTLSQWGVILMALMLLLAGTIVFGRCRKVTAVGNL